jgi:hypothetical protein
MTPTDEPTGVGATHAAEPLVREVREEASAVQAAAHIARGLLSTYPALRRAILVLLPLLLSPVLLKTVFHLRSLNHVPAGIATEALWLTAVCFIVAKRTRVAVGLFTLAAILGCAFHLIVWGVVSAGLAWLTWHWRNGASGASKIPASSTT